MRDLADVATTPDTAAALDLARWLGMTWKLSIESGGRLILPETPRKLGLAPSAAELGVVFTYGETLEIWRLEAWDRYFTEHGADLHQLLMDSA
jgi:DNA-binding transcriptional regulator/RsmH inhibitor MraZ